MHVNNPIRERQKEITKVGLVKLEEFLTPCKNIFEHYQWDMPMDDEAKYFPCQQIIPKQSEKLGFRVSQSLWL